MRIIDKATRDSLIELSKTLNFDSQKLLRSVEDEIAKEFGINIFNSVNKDEARYLLLTSLPFAFKKVNFELEELWNLNCKKCHTVIYRKTVPTGNLKPKNFVVGDAPGVGDGELNDRFDRAWVYGPSSHLLRKALLEVGEYFNSWFTNILKCSTPKNRPSNGDEVKACISQLKKEINLLKPKRIILLGKHIQNVFFDFGIPVIKLYHPTYFVRKGIDYKGYSKVLKEKLK